MIRFLVTLIIMLFSSAGMAGQYTKKGKVVDLLVRTGSSHFAILYVDGFEEAGGCRVFRDHVVVSIPDDEKANVRYSMLLAMHLANKDVHVMIDSDKQASDGSCILQDLRLNKEF